ncbi:MAG TPA: hypothetical protein VFI96_05730 [Longimicrobiaceae bacterium]|nr:hypothetical protein [Longimicrobiaceae bacterium]
MLRTARFLSSFLRSASDGVQSDEVEVLAAGEALPATLFRPRTRRSLPGWVVLHGITVPGRHHAALQRFARALAGSGAVVLVPEIRTWTELTVDSGAADRAIAAAAAYLAEVDGVREGGVGVVGFSFGATQALITAARSAERHSIRAVVGFGGYADLRRAIRFMFTGEHEWEGVRYHLDPDPYGRWIAVANYLTRTAGYEEMGGVAEGCRALAEEAGRVGGYAGDPYLDPLKMELGTALNEKERDVWKIVAPLTSGPIPLEAARALAGRIADTALSVDPGLDPAPALPRLAATRIVLSHGVADHLVPFTESLRLRSLLPPDADATVTLTRLFAHSGGAPALRPWQYPREIWRYLRLLDRALRA